MTTFPLVVPPIPRPTWLRRAVWPGMVFALLGLNLSICTTTAILATRDPSHRVVDSYDAKASAWDAHKQREASEQALGWQLRCDARVQQNRAVLTMHVYDKFGTPLKRACVRIEAFHNARPNDVQLITLSDAGLGEHTGGLDVPKDGQWTLHVHVTRTTDLGATEELDRDLTLHLHH